MSQSQTFKKGKLEATRFGTSGGTVQNICFQQAKKKEQEYIIMEI